MPLNKLGSKPFSIKEDKVQESSASTGVGSFYYEHFVRPGAYALSGGHYHTLYEIYFLASGSLSYFIENKVFRINQGDLVLIPKRAIHKTIYDNAPSDRYLLNFSSAYIASALSEPVRNLFRSNIYIPSADILPKIVDIFEKIGNEYPMADPYSSALISCYMTELFTLLLRNPSSDTAEKATVGSIPIEHVMSYITAHFNEALTLEEMAAMASLSPSYFSRIFKNITGFGFKEYITIKRVKEAARLLSHTDNSVCSIAYDCGFNDSNYFSSVFKEINGVSPLRYRKQHRSNTGKIKNT